MSSFRLEFHFKEEVAFANKKITEMGSKNIACSVLRSIWSCTKPETKSLMVQKSEFAFSALGSS